LSNRWAGAEQANTIVGHNLTIFSESKTFSKFVLQKNIANVSTFFNSLQSGDGDPMLTYHTLVLPLKNGYLVAKFISRIFFSSLFVFYHYPYSR
jgi:hypothetical protein